MPEIDRKHDAGRRAAVDAALNGAPPSIVAELGGPAARRYIGADGVVDVAALQRVLYMADRRIPGLRFEWHPGKRRVYMVRIGRVPEIGEPIAFDIANHGAAYNAVLIFCRGWMAQAAPDLGRMQGQQVG